MGPVNSPIICVDKTDIPDFVKENKFYYQCVAIANTKKLNVKNIKKYFEQKYENIITLCNKEVNEVTGEKKRKLNIKKEFLAILFERKVKIQRGNSTTE